MNEAQKQYKVSLNRKQIELLATVLEQHARIMCGHLNTSTVPALDYALDKEYPEFNEYLQRREFVERQLDNIKAIVWPELGNGNYGVKYDKESDMAYEMYKMIRYQFELERMKEKGDKYIHNVHSTLPLHYSGEDLIKIEKL